MIKYVNYAITFAEVPDEVSLAISISNCGGHCKECHSPELRRDIGEDLEADLPKLIKKYGNQITCVCFLGQGNDTEALNECIQYAHWHGYKTCLYTGYEDYPTLNYLDYLKVGPYLPERGGLDNPNTNQRMYRFYRQYAASDPSFEVCAPFVDDITYKFWKKKQ